MYQKINLIVCMTLVSVYVSAQNLNDDLQKIVSRMDLASSVSLEIDIKMFSRKGGTVIYSTQAAVHKQGNKSKNVLSEMEYVSSGAYSVRIDHEEKAVLIQKKESVSKSELEALKNQIDIKEIQKLFKTEKETNSPSVKLVSSSNGMKTYSISGVTGIKEVIIVLDIRKNSIRSISYEYGKEGSNQYIVLKYNTFDFDKNLNSEFDLSNYFTIENNTYKLSNALTGYTLYTEE